MSHTAEELEVYNSLYADVNRVYNIFKEKFGEERVDLQGVLSIDSPEYKDILQACTTTETRRNALAISPNEGINIIVYWPSVVITNEHNKSIRINDLFAKIKIEIDGKIPYEHHGFLLNRSTYTHLQFISNYMHSHISSIPKQNFTEFQRPCLGTGPIRGTINTLKNDSDDIYWMLFCEELKRYVTVESLAGVPYHRLEELGGRGYRLAEHYDLVESNSRFEDFPFLLPFVKDYIKHGNLRFSFINGQFTLGLSARDYWIDVSNFFIKRYNQGKIDIGRHNVTSLTDKVVCSNGNLYTVRSNSRENYSSYIGQRVITFKGREYNINITSNEEEIQMVTLISWDIAMQIMTLILRTLNYFYYGRNTNTEEAESDKKCVFI